MNKTLLQVNASLFSAAGQSSALANEFVAGWKKRNPGATTIVRDLASVVLSRRQAAVVPSHMPPVAHELLTAPSRLEILEGPREVDVGASHRIIALVVLVC